VPLSLSYEQTVDLQPVVSGPPSNSAKRRHSCKKKSFFEVEYPEVTFNMVGSSTTPRKPKGKQPAINFEDFDAKCSSGLKEVLIKPEGIYQCICIWTRAIALVDYSA